MSTHFIDFDKSKLLSIIIHELLGLGHKYHNTFLWRLKYCIEGCNRNNEVPFKNRTQFHFLDALMHNNPRDYIFMLCII